MCQLSAAGFLFILHQSSSEEEADEEEGGSAGGGVELKGTAVCCGSVKLPFVSVQAGRRAACASTADGSLHLLHFCWFFHYVRKRARLQNDRLLC